MQLLRRLAEVQAFGHSNEISGVSQFHVAHCTLLGNSLFAIDPAFEARKRPSAEKYISDTGKVSLPYRKMYWTGFVFHTILADTQRETRRRALVGIGTKAFEGNHRI
jgi:hypothetical protein